MTKILAIDANRYLVRLAVVESDGYMYAAIEAKPGDYDKMSMFIRAQAIQSCHRIAITGSPLDQWPSELHHILEDEIGYPIEWVSPAFLRAISTDLAYWQHRRKFDRARLLAVASASRTMQTIDPHGLGRKWQRLLIDEMVQRLADATPAN